MENKRFSVKKVLGVLGTLVIFFIAIFVIIKDPSQVGNVLWPTMSLVIGLFGIKTAGGVMLKKGGVISGVNDEKEVERPV